MGLRVDGMGEFCVVVMCCYGVACTSLAVWTVLGEGEE